MVRVLAASSARLGACALALLVALGTVAGAGAGVATGAHADRHRVLASSTCPGTTDWNSIVTDQLACKVY